MNENSSQDGTCKLTFDEVRCDRTGNMEMISIKDDMVSVKDEPMSDQEYIETSSCPPSPCSAIDDSPRHYGKVCYNNERYRRDFEIQKRIKTGLI